MLLQADDARVEKHDPLTCFPHFSGSWLHVFTSSPPPLISSFYRSLFDVINTHFLCSFVLFLSPSLLTAAISRTLPLYKPYDLDLFNISSHCCFFRDQALGFCEAPGDNLDCNRCYINKDELY